MTTLIVEPDWTGHHLQSVRFAVEVVGRAGPVVMLGTRGLRDTEEYAVQLDGVDLEVREVFDERVPPTRTMLDAVAAVLDGPGGEAVDTVVLMDGDQALKRWWYQAPRVLRRRGPRPRVVFFLTRYPTRLAWNDRVGWRLRAPKAALAVAARATGTLDYVAGFSGRDDVGPGWIVQRAGDPEVCSAHHRDRDALRDELDLPRDRALVGIFGVINERRNAPLVWEAMEAVGLDADLLLAGAHDDEVRAWIASLDQGARRVISYDAFLPNDLVDKLVATSDVCPLPLTNNGPSGTMGKALAADVPVVTAGSVVRARELVARDGGELAEMDALSIGRAMQRALALDPDRPRRSTVAPSTPEVFAQRMLGVDADGRPVRRRRGMSPTARSRG
jgi:glycosyltransferase involved in cell wall biosynthesis